MNDAQIAALKSELQSGRYDGATADAAFALLNDPQVVETESERLVVLTPAMLLAVLSADSAAKVVNYANLGRVIDAIETQERDRIAAWVRALQLGGILTAEDAAELGKKLAETETQTTSEKQLPRIAEAFAGVPGMPNRIKRDDFDKVWAEARG